jgi:hypothetical protein
MERLHNTMDGMRNRENLMTEPENEGQLPEVNDYLQEVDEDGQDIAIRPQ